MIQNVHTIPVVALGGYVAETIWKSYNVCRHLIVLPDGRVVPELA
jgi:hypothetical protein